MSYLSRLNTFCRYVIKQQLVEDVAAFERQCGLDFNALSNEEKESTLNDYTIETICTIYPQLNARWIRTGKGNMLNYTISEDSFNEEAIDPSLNTTLKSKKDTHNIDTKLNSIKKITFNRHKKESDKVIEENDRHSTFILSTSHELENNIKENSRVSENGINYLEKEYRILLSAFPFNIRLFINKYLPTVYDYLKFINSKYQFSSLLKERDELNLFVKLFGIIYSDYPIKKYDGYEVYQQYKRERNSIESFKAKESSTPFAHYNEDTKILQNQNIIRNDEQERSLITRPKNKSKEKSFFSTGLSLIDYNTIVLPTYDYGDRLCFIQDELLYQHLHSKDFFYRADNSRPFISFKKDLTRYVHRLHSSKTKNSQIASTKKEHRSDLPWIVPAPKKSLELEDTVHNQDKKENINSTSDKNTNNNNDAMEKLLNEPIYTIPVEEKRTHVSIIRANVVRKSEMTSEVLYYAINKIPGKFLTMNLAIIDGEIIEDIQKENFFNPGGIILGKFIIHYNINDLYKIIIFPSR